MGCECRIPPVRRFFVFFIFGLAASHVITNASVNPFATLRALLVLYPQACDTEHPGQCAEQLRFKLSPAQSFVTFVGTPTSDIQPLMKARFT